MPQLPSLPEDYSKLQDDYQRALQYIRHKTNQLLKVMGTMPLLPNEIDDSNIIELDPIGIVSDSFAQILQNLKETNDNLKNAYSEIEAILDSTPAGIVIIDAETHTILEANPVCVELIGLPKDEIVGKVCCRFFCPAQIDECPITVKKEKVDKSERVMLTASGAERAIIKSVSAVTINQKEVLIESFIDITESKRMQEELIKTQRLESLGILAGGIAHDFNNILTAILGNISMAMNELADQDTRAYERLQKAEWATQKAQGLARQLLTFSKGGAPVLKPTSLTDLLRDTVSFILSGKDVKFELHASEDMPMIKADEGQMSQVFQNLTLNALEAMSSGGVLQAYIKRTHSDTERPHKLATGDYIKITFRDTGAGVPDGLREKIFDPFFTTKKQGTGLGLSMVYSIVKKHGGYIFLDNHPEGGAMFCILLPIKEDINVSKKTLAPEETEAKQVVPDRKRVLLMDDDEMVVDVVSEMLDMLGYDFKIVRNGEEAIAAYKESLENNKKYDVVLMDLTVPGGMGGKEAIKLIKDFDPQVKALVSSGYDVENTAISYKSYGFIGSIAKPFKISELKRVIDEAVSIPLAP